MFEVAKPFLLALGIGLLIGIERERAHADDPERHPLGARSFTLVALIGALAAHLAIAGSLILLACSGCRPRTSSPPSPSPSPASAPSAPPLVLAPSAPPSLIPPRRIKYVEPVRPKGKGGNVVLELFIDKTGKVESVEVREPFAPAFDEAAVMAARQWEYTPTIYRGEPAVMYLTVTVKFDP